MKPNFALTLSHEDIGLLHRVGGAWVRVGAVSVDDPELGASLSYLRRSALGLEPHGFATKVVIPGSEILYTRLHAPGPDLAARRAQIAKALEGMTPYAVADLAFDWSGDGPEVDVAVVARETLAEAEAFAVDHRFNPVSFVAIPGDLRFAGEPFFGLSAQAAIQFADGQTVEPDTSPIILTDRPFVGGAFPEAEGDATAAALTAAQETAEPPPPLSDQKAEAPPAQAEEVLPAPATLAVPDPAPAGQVEKAAPNLVSEPEPPLRLDHVALPEAHAPAARPIVLPEIEPADPPETGFAVALIDQSEDPDTQAWPGEDEDAAPQEDAPAPIRPDPRPARKAGKGDKGGKKLAGAARVRSLPERKINIHLRAEPEAPVVEAARSEAEAMTVFGARSQPVGGKPRFLGLILTGVLLLLLALVAVWASFFLVDPAPRSQVNLPAAEQDLAFAPPAPEAGPEASAPGAETAETAETPADVQDAAAPVDPPETAPKTAQVDPDSDGPAPVGEGLTVEDIALPRPDAALANPLAELRLSTSQPQPSVPAHVTGLPPFDALFQFDGAGNLVVTPEGVVTPDGYRLVAARPEVTPPRRPGAEEEAGAIEPLAAESAALASAEPAPEAAAAPETAPEAPPEAAQAEPAPEAEATALVFEPEARGPRLRPRQRPAEAASPEPAAATEAAPAPEAESAPEAEASAPPEEESSLQSPRPRARPASVVAEAQRQIEAEQTAALAAAAAAAASAASTAAIDQSASADPSLVIASSRRPAARPPDFARAVEAAVAAAVAPPAASTRPAAPTPADEDDGEPEVTRAAPNIPTTANVARQATQTRALNLGRVALIGIYGTANNRQALVREPGGRMVRVKVGDRFDGGQVTAITASELRYQKGNRLHALAMP